MVTTNPAEQETYPVDKMGEAKIILFSRASVNVFAAVLIGDILGGAAVISGA